MSSLPIEAIRPRLADALRTSPRLVLSAPTGSGKSTQLPQMLVDEGVVPTDQQILVLQPRRLAARMLAKRVATERNVRLGDEAGYHIRFDKVFSHDTRIKFVTEGILFQMMLSNPDLPGVGAVVFDEFHERHLYSDLGISMVRDLIATTRADLKLVVMSATLDTEALRNFLQPCEVLSVEGRTFPITTAYLDRPTARSRNPRHQPRVWDLAADAFAQLATSHPEGDVLIFMPGAYEIRKTIETLQRHKAARDCLLLPLYGELSPAEQDAAVSSQPQRKVVVATNVAETSLTIDGIQLVIDSGLARIARFDPHRGINTLLIEKISHASADQRAGRAGRTAVGHCLRLWDTHDHNSRPARETPEVKRIDLSETLLNLKSSGIADISRFAWFEAPTPTALDQAHSLLRDLGALDRENDLTAIGRKMAHFPVHPRYARMMLAAHDLECVYWICLIAAFTQGRRILLPLHDQQTQQERDTLLGETDSDFLHLLGAWELAKHQNYNPDFCRHLGIHGQAARQAEQLARQFLAIAERQGLDTAAHPIDEQAVCRCLLIGFSDQLAVRDHPGTLRCSLVHNRRGELRRQSAIRHASHFVAAEIDEVPSRDKVTVLLGTATAIHPDWLREYFPDDFSTTTETYWDDSQRRCAARSVTLFRDLILHSENAGTPPADQASALLAAKVIDGTLILKKWDGKVEAFIQRINFAAKNCPELEIAPIDQEARQMIIDQVCQGAISYKDIKERAVLPAFTDWLSPAQQAGMQSLVPETMSIPSRKNPLRIRYDAENQKAVIASKLQDFYDIPAASLTICNGHIPLTIELLAPNGRPAQVTADLDSFWTTSYLGVKKDLKGRYPKHEWR